MADPEKNALVENEDAEVIDTEGTDKDAELPGNILQNPELLAALQGRIQGMAGNPSWYYQSLPKVVKRRIKALKKLQNEQMLIEGKFYEEVHALECKYAAKYIPIFDKRKEFVSGNVEPNDDDCDWPSDEEVDDELSEELKAKAKIEDEKKENSTENNEEKKEENPVGVPEFWLTIFKNVELLADMVQEHDEPILRHLLDIKIKHHDKDPYGFTLEFFFTPNDYFSNTCLTKEYEMRMEPDPTDPFSYEGPEIIKCKGCPIDWKKGKNVTVKTIKKTQKHRGRGVKRTVTKQVQNDSFFNFFSPPQQPENPDENELDEDTEALLSADFEIGHFIRERIVPRAVLYFTGEALDEDDEDYEEEGEEEDGDEEGDFDEDGDPDFNPTAKNQKPEECKQQ